MNAPDLHVHSTFSMLPERIRDKISITKKGCWNWRAALNDAGYGMVWDQGAMRRAHRVVYRLLVGEITEETLDHLCRNRRCVNPQHLEPCSLAENKSRGNSPAAIHARVTRCPKGHAYTPENTVICPRKDGRTFRQCRRCRNEHARNKYHERKSR